MAATWFVRGNGQVYGPLDSARLKQLATEGKIDQSTDVAQTQKGPWVPASRVRGLFASSQPPSTTPAQSVANDIPDLRQATCSVAPARSTVSSKRLDTASKQYGLFHFQRIAIAAASIVGLATAMLPWHSDWENVEYAWQTPLAIFSIISIVLFVVPLIIALLGEWASPVRGTILWVAVMAPTLSGLLVFNQMLELTTWHLKIMTEKEANPVVSARILLNSIDRETARLKQVDHDDVLALSINQLTSGRTGIGGHVLLIAVVFCVSAALLLSSGGQALLSRANRAAIK